MSLIIAYVPLGPNEEGWPEDWPTSSFPVGQGQPAPEGWVTLPLAEYTALQARLTPEVSRLVEAKAEAQALAKRVQAAREQKLSALTVEVRDFIYAHYRVDQQQTLQALWTEAILTANHARASYIGGALAWVKAAIGLYYPARDAVVAAMTVEEVEAVAINYSVLPEDPKVDVEVALAMV